jgi:hypothetical protein
MDPEKIQKKTSGISLLVWTPKDFKRRQISLLVWTPKKAEKSGRNSSSNIK